MIGDRSTLCTPNPNHVKSEASYRSLFDLSPEATYLLDPGGGFVLANAAGLELLRCTGEGLKGKSIVELRSVRHETPQLSSLYP